MPRRVAARTAMFVVLAVVAMAGPPPALHAQEVRLAWQFRPGDVLHYRQLIASRSGTPMGDVVQRQTTRIRQEVLAVGPDGVAELRVTYEALRAVHDGAMGRVEYDSESGQEPSDPAMRMLAGMVGGSFQVSMAPDGEVRGVSGLDDFTDRIVAAVVDDRTEGAGELRLMLQALFGEGRMQDQLQQAIQLLPTGPVAPGAEWTAELSLQLPFGTSHAAYTYRLEEVFERAGNRIARISVSGGTSQVEMDPDNPMAGLLEISGGDLTGAMEFDVDRGVLLRVYTSAMMGVSAMGMTMEFESTQDMELLDG